MTPLVEAYIKETYNTSLEELKALRNRQFNNHSFIKDNPLEIIIKPEALDLSNVKEDSTSEKLWRPISFSQYIGQDEAKERVKDYIQGCTKFNEQFPHTFLSAPSGCGKTTFALILANMLNKKFVSCTAGEMKSEQSIVDKICQCEGGIIFLDEAHRISIKVGTFLLPVLEDFKIQDRSIKPFTMIFATTHSGNIAKNLEALVQRFNLKINLKHYEINELIKIIKQYHKQKYPNIQIDEEIFKSIANNCRRTPRIALGLLREYVYTLNLPRVFTNNQIIKDGLTINDFKVLKYLQMTNGAGKNSIAKYLRVEPNTVEFENENYLIFLNLITVENKRKLTNIGKEFLNRYENEKFS